MDFPMKTLLSPKHVFYITRCCRKVCNRKLCTEIRENPWRADNKPKHRTVSAGQRLMTLETGKLAKFADGCAVAKLGETSVMVTAVGSTKSTRSLGFLPLTVDYRQKAAAAGRIPTNHFRKEASWASEKEILTSRMIDRSIRPLFPKWYNSDTQVLCNLLAVDGVCDPEVLSINAASTALALSDIPWNGPVGAVGVGYLDGEVIINPTRNELKHSQLDLVVSATSDSKIVMLEASAEVLPKDTFKFATAKGVRAASRIAKEIQEMCKECGKAKREAPGISGCSEEVKASMKSLAGYRIREIYSDSTHHKISRDVAVREVADDILSKLKEEYPEEDPSLAQDQMNALIKETFRELIFERNLRCDGRNLKELRPISCEVDLYQPLHGSAIFQRGQTQVFCTLTFDTPYAAARVDTLTEIITGMKEKNFFLHYEFPPYATNETGRPVAGRREHGHGALAEKALRPVVPNDYPFTIRLSAEVLESNGSSSMASVCAGSLALMDAGVPISEPVAGVAVGLVTKLNTDGEIEDFRLLTDLLGIEDYMGDMDFKLAGTHSGITALQADIKLEGIPISLVTQAIDKASNGQKEILKIMNETQKEPRETRKANGPLLENLDIPQNKHKYLVGSGGINMKKLTAETGVTLIPVDNDSYRIFAPNQTAMDEAKEKINELISEERVPDLEFGAIYNAKIVEIRDYGIMVQLHESMQPILVHVSQLDNRKISHPAVLDLVVDQIIPVKYFGRDPASGQHRLSRKAIYSPASAVIKSLDKK